MGAVFEIGFAEQLPQRRLLIKQDKEVEERPCASGQE
jgi:hypothetical protein